MKLKVGSFNIIYYVGIMKICNKCKIEKSYDQFHKSKSEKDGYKYSCKECVIGHPPRQIPNISKMCVTCNIEQPIENFSKTTKHYRRSDCNKCKNKKQQIKRDLNPIKEKLRKRKVDLKKKYSLTIEDYELMYENQSGKCKICNKELRLLNVDHCHIIMKVRGLLCTQCNSILGMSNDNIEILEKAIIYLKENQ